MNKEIVCTSVWEFARLKKTPGIELKGKLDTKQLTPRIRNKLIKTLRTMNARAGGYSSQAQAVMKIIRDDFELPEIFITKDWFRLTQITPDIWEKAKNMSLVVATVNRLDGKTWDMERLEKVIEQSQDTKNWFSYHVYGKDEFDPQQLKELQTMVMDYFKGGEVGKRFEAAADFIEQGGELTFGVKG